jgi:ATP-dependent DNA helicase 2 subunit 1
LQAIALDEEIPENPEDKTIPRYRQIDKRAGQYVLDWGEELDKEFAEHQKKNGGHNSMPAVGSKRTADGSVGGSSSKKVKKEDAGEDAPDDGEMRAKWEKGQLEKFTVPVLKAFCQAKKLAFSGRKGDLVDRINDYFESK